MTVEMQRAAARVEGGYRLLSVPELCAAWTAYRQKLIEFRDLRVWLAAHEMVSRRCQMGRGRLASHTLAELKGLVGGVGGEHLRASLNRLERHRLMRWSEASIDFCASEAIAQLGFGMTSQIVNSKRRVPIPRRTLRFLAKASRPTLVATVLGYLLRCVYARGTELFVEGCCAASWIAETFGVDLRNVRRAKATLQSLGWLTATGSPHWHRQRWGAKARVNPQWSHAGPTGLPPRKHKSTTNLPPPLNKELSLKEISNPEPANRTDGASAKRLGKGTLKDVSVADLRDPSRTQRLWRAAVIAGWLNPSEADRLNCFAAAERAKRVGTRNPCGLFVTLMRDRLWKLISQEDEDRARQVLHSLRSTDTPRSREPADEPWRQAPQDVGPVHELVIQSLASVSHLHGNDFPGDTPPPSDRWPEDVLAERIGGKVEPSEKRLRVLAE